MTRRTTLGTVGLELARVLLLLSTLGTPIYAQTPPSGASSNTPLATGDVPRLIESSTSRLRAISVVLDREANVDAARSALQDLQIEAHALMREANEKLPFAAALRDVDDLYRRWARLRDQLVEQTARLGKSVETIEAIEAELRLSDRAWAQTPTVGPEEDLQRALAARVRSLRTDIETETLAARATRAALLTIQAAQVELSDTASEQLELIESKRAEMRRGLLSTDTNPLWDAIGGNSDSAVRGADLSTTGGARIKLVQGYMASHAAATAAYLLVFAGLATVTLRLRRGVSAAPAGDAARQRLGRIESRPVAAAALVSLLLWFWIEPSLSPPMMALRRLLLIAPLARLLGGGLFAELPAARWGVVALCLADVPREALSSLSTLSRFYLLAEGVWAVLFLAWLRQPAQLSRLPVSAARRRILAAGYAAAILLLALSAASNILGNVSLANLLTDGALNSGYAALVLLEAAHVLEALLLVALASSAAQLTQAVRHHEVLIRRRGLRAIRQVMLAIWVATCFYLFALFDPAIEALRRLLQARLEVGSLALSAGDVLALVATVWIASLLARFVSFLLEEEVLPRLSLQRGVPTAVATSARYAILLFGGLAGLSAAGLEFGRLTVLLGAFGVGISFGLQNIVNNFVSGLILLVERPIRTGDTVEVEQITGEVRSIGIRSSVVRTFEGAEVIVPNGTLLSQKVVNWTLSDQYRRIEVPVGVAYGNHPKQVIEILEAVAKAQPDLVTTPEPRVLFLGFGDSSLNFSLRVWTGRYDSFPQVRSDLCVAVYEALLAAGMEIPFPQHDIHLRALAASEAK